LVGAAATGVTLVGAGGDASSTLRSASSINESKSLLPGGGRESAASADSVLLAEVLAEE